MMRRATQADVAQLAGVSPTAVSLILNGRGGTRLSAAVTARVHEAARELNYRPNLMARALSMQRSHAIGLISDRASVSPEASALIRGVLREAREHGLTVLTAETDGDPRRESESVEALVDRAVDGLLFVVSRSRDIEIPDSATASRLVILNARSRAETLSVLPDEYRGGRDLVDRLVSAGHGDRLVVIGAGEPDTEPDATFTVRRRLEGIWSGFRAHGIRPVDTVSLDEWELDAGRDAMRTVLSRSGVPRTVVCLNDRLAFGAFRALGEAGLAIPDDVSVASFDDDVIAQYLQPELTSVRLPYVTMGELAVKLFLDPDAEHREHLVEMPIVVRGSVAGLSA